jgi:hypothetical protein
MRVGGGYWLAIEGHISRVPHLGARASRNGLVPRFVRQRGFESSPPKC